MSKVAGANLPRTVERASGQALLIRFAEESPIGSSRHCRSLAYRVPLNRLRDAAESPIRSPYLRRSLACRDPFSVAKPSYRSAIQL